MRKTRVIILILMFAGWGFSDNKIYAQDDKAKTIPLTVSTIDERFSIKNVSFFKRLEKLSANLNISFELHNNTDKDIKLKVILIAFKRVDSTDQNLRRFIKYPQWRKRDLDKEIQKNTLLDSLPRIDKAAVDPNLKNGNIFPEFQQYLQYIGNNTTIGSDIVIKGINTGAAENTGNQDIYIVNQAMKTFVFGKLKAQFTSDNEFFNYFGIILVDPEQKKIVGSELFYFDTPFSTH